MKFESAVRETMGGLTAESRVWLDYALGSNARGEQLVSMLETSLVGNLAGKRVIDLGSGYGGTCIAAANRGASVLGIEYTEHVYNLGLLNLEDHPDADCRMVRGDAMDLSLPDTHGQFDLVICDNVIEHVSDARRLLDTIRRLMAPGAVAYITTPNGRATSMVRSDCHYMLFGISLLDRFVAQAFFNEVGWAGEYHVGDYFDHAQYECMFADNGLALQQLVPLTPTAERLQQLRSEIDAIRTTPAPNCTPATRKYLEAVVAHYCAGFDARIQEHDRETDPVARVQKGSAIDRDYGLALWYFVGRKPLN